MLFIVGYMVTFLGTGVLLELTIIVIYCRNRVSLEITVPANQMSLANSFGGLGGFKG